MGTMPLKRRVIEERFGPSLRTLTRGGRPLAALTKGLDSGSSSRSRRMVFAIARATGGATAFPTRASLSLIEVAQNWYDRGNPWAEAHSRSVNVRYGTPLRACDGMTIVDREPLALVAVTVLHGRSKLSGKGILP